MMLTRTTAGTVTKAGTTLLTAKDTLTLNMEKDRTTTRKERAMVAARRELCQAQTEPGGRGAMDKTWTPALTGTSTTAKTAGPVAVTSWATILSEGKEEEGGIGAGTILMTTLHPQNLPESWIHWRSPSMFCW